MRKLLFFCALTLMLAACTGDTPATTDPAADTAAQDSSALAESAAPDDGLPTDHNCRPAGEVLEGNMFWARRQQLLIVITADSTTTTADGVPGHRVLTIYDTRDCSQIDRHVLPVNRSADFPYYIADILYNQESNLVGIRGFSNLYVYDAAARQLLPPLNPQFKTRRPGVDAQSGMILRLEIWEDYLVGYAQDRGAFVFNMTDSSGLQPVLPFAEYRTEDDDYRSLFLLSTGQGVQGMVPVYDFDEDRFRLQPLFAQPTRLSLNVAESARNNRFLVMRQEGNAAQPYAIDLLAGELVELPANVRGQATQEILSWLRANRS